MLQEKINAKSLISTIPLSVIITVGPHSTEEPLTLKYLVATLSEEVIVQPEFPCYCLYIETSFT